MSKKKLLAELEEHCKKQDWHYQYEDNYTIWKKHSSNMDHIRNLLERAKEEDFLEEAKEIYNKYRSEVSV